MNKFHILCFIEELEEDTELNNYINCLDERGANVHLYTSSCTQNIQPYHVLSCLDELGRVAGEVYILLTDIPQILKMCYRLYHQVIDGFIFLKSDHEREIKLEEIYRAIDNLPSSECAYKGIYASNYESIGYGNRIQPIDTFFDSKIGDFNNPCSFINYYYIENQFYCFEPVRSGEERIITNEKVISKNQSYATTTYAYSGCYYIFDQIVKEIKDFELNPHETSNRIEQILVRLQGKYESQSSIEKIMTERCLWDILKSTDNIFITNLILSWLIYVGDDYHAMEKMLDFTISSTLLHPYQKFFIWNQAKRMLLICKNMQSSRIGIAYRILYNEVYNEYYNVFEHQLDAIRWKDRSSDFILVFTYSFLSERHAPTRTTLERVYTLGKHLGKKVMLINTRETSTQLGCIPLFYTYERNIIKEYNDLEVYRYKDYEFPFYQFDTEMPDYNEVDMMLEFVRKERPYFILNIGGGSILSDLCSNIVPVLSMSVAFSTLPMTMSKLSIIGRRVKDMEWDSLYKQGYDRDNIIEGRFTFDLIERHSNITREELNLPLDKFLLLVVGIRLDTEITGDFIKTMERTYSHGTHLVFAGKFDTYDSFCEKYRELKEHSTYIGYCSDMLALNAICDLYVNPHRLGGGFSVIEAFHEGKPGVSIEFGDVATAAGEEFCVKNYDEMVTRIIRYVNDREFYQGMSSKAFERAAIMTDSKSAMEEIIEQGVKSRYFF